MHGKTTIKVIKSILKFQGCDIEKDSNDQNVMHTIYKSHLNSVTVPSSCTLAFRCKRIFICCVKGREETHRHTAKNCRSMEKAVIKLRDILSVALYLFILSKQCKPALRPIQWVLTPFHWAVAGGWGVQLVSHPIS